MSAPGPPGGDRPSDAGPSPAGRRGTEAGRRADAEERRTERQVWWYLAYFLFGIHLVALIMIYAVRHGG